MTDMDSTAQRFIPHRQLCPLPECPAEKELLAEGRKLMARPSETGWLIEGDGRYWDGRFADARGFTSDPNEACRFARFEDAERVKHWLLKEHAFALRTTEHAWMDGPKPTAKAKC